MKTIICTALIVLVGFTLQSCLEIGEPSNLSEHEYLIGKWGLKSVRIEEKDLKWTCEKESTFISIIKIDTIELDSTNPEFQDSVWEVQFTRDTIFSPNTVENRIKFDWALHPYLFIENEFLTEKFKYDVQGDTLSLENERTELLHKINLYYQFKISRESRELEIKPGVFPDSIKSPVPISNKKYCPASDSIERKAKLISAFLWKK